eukprot:TRINITY_DN6404_c0_g5_i1.p1 TRINITY_DN6404_c0_g5~~TRINITY_DN6404_c0_g5_i1.p1  ORF type:complete len:410 (-),score=76.62 TRINITY_DN6404_c0_g5_i1:183-1412(-)
MARCLGQIANILQSQLQRPLLPRVPMRRALLLAALVGAGVVPSEVAVARAQQVRDCRAEGACALPWTAECWPDERLFLRCCNGLAASMEHCFDDAFPAAECCDKRLGGVAIIAPGMLQEAVPLESSIRPSAFGAGESVAKGESSTWSEHPALSEAQFAWERAHQRASRVTRRRVLGVDLAVVHFKAATTDVNYMLAELEADTYELSGVAVPGGGVAVDIGANTGAVSVLMAKLFGLRVLALEPVASTFRYLLWTLRLNGVTDLVWPLNAAAHQSSASLTFGHTAARPMMSMSSNVGQNVADEKTKGRGWYTPTEIVTSPALSLPEVLRRADAMAGGGRIEVLKLDCEGCEYGLLESEEARVAIREVPVLIGELHRGWAAPEVHSDLDQAVTMAMCGLKVQGRVNGCQAL